MTVCDSQKEYWHGGGEEGRDWRHFEVGETHKDKSSGIAGYGEDHAAPCGSTGGCSGDWGSRRRQSKGVWSEAMRALSKRAGKLRMALERVHLSLKGGRREHGADSSGAHVVHSLKCGDSGLIVELSPEMTAVVHVETGAPATAGQ